MFTREITGIIIVLFVLSVILLASTLLFKFVLFLVSAYAIFELYFLIKKPYWISSIILIFLIIFLLFINSFAENRVLFLYAILISAVNDSVAYYFGKKFGVRKIFPSTSPNKTLEGLISGVLISSAFLYFLSYVQIYNLNFYQLKDLGLFLYLILILCALTAVLGDFLESKMKRAAGVKDSGSLFPGHGGMLDRIDSHIFVIPIFFILIGAIN